MNDDIALSLLVCVGIPVALGIYLMPSIIATRKNKKNAAAIVVFNLALGWTFLGYIIVLVWALSADTDEQTVIVQNSMMPPTHTTPPALPPTQTLEQKLTELLSLKDKGLITEDEYTAKRSKLIS